MRSRADKDYLQKIEASGTALEPLRAHLHKTSTNMTIIDIQLLTMLLDTHVTLAARPLFIIIVRFFV